MVGTALNALQCAVTKFASATSLECALANLLDLKSFGFRSYEKKGWGSPLAARSRAYRCAFFPGVRVQSGAMDPLRELGKLLLVFGAVLVAAGAVMLLGAKLPFRLGRLPGDIVYQGRHTTFYFPIVTCLLVSLALTLVLWLWAHFRR